MKLLTILLILPVLSLAQNTSLSSPSPSPFESFFVVITRSCEWKGTPWIERKGDVERVVGFDGDYYTIRAQDGTLLDLEKSSADQISPLNAATLLLNARDDSDRTIDDLEMRIKTLKQLNSKYVELIAVVDAVIKDRNSYSKYNQQTQQSRSYSQLQSQINTLAVQQQNLKMQQQQNLQQSQINQMQNEQRAWEAQHSVSP